MGLIEIVPMSLREANAYVTEHHRHHGVSRGHKFSVAIADKQGTVRGVAIVGRPVSRHLDNGWTLEVTRCCTDGVANGCSMLYGAARRVAFALGYRRIVTYTLASESGGSLKASGWRWLGERKGGTWSSAERPRVDKHPTGAKMLWEETKGEN